MKKEEIKQCAKTLYLIPDDQNPQLHKHSTRDISEQIKHKLNKKVSYSTIANWARENNWEAEFTEAKKKAVTELIEKGEKEGKKLNESYKEASKNGILKVLSHDMAAFELMSELQIKALHGDELTHEQLTLLKAHMDSTSKRIIDNMNIDGSLGEHQQPITITIDKGDLK